jgi:hypothetical protein
VVHVVMMIERRIDGVQIRRWRFRGLHMFRRQRRNGLFTPAAPAAVMTPERAPMRELPSNTFDRSLHA